MGPECVIRRAEVGDVRSICAFGDTHVRPHYTPLIGAQAADSQVSRWWTEPQIQDAVSHGRIVIAQDADQVVGVAQSGRNGGDHVLYKLYVDPRYRGQGLGPRLIEAITRQLPPGGSRLCVEHFAGNERAGAFYEREGFTVTSVEPSDTGNPALDVVWRTRDL